MAQIIGEAFAELPELSQIGNGDFENYVKEWEKNYGGAGQAAKYARDWFDSTLADKDSTYIQPFSQSELTWGKMYHFEYDPVTRDKLSYFDNSPMVISLGKHQNGKTELGMNLNFLPKAVRYWMVGRVFQVYAGDIKNASKGKKWRRAFEQEEVQIEYDMMKKWLWKYGFDFCIRQYYMNKTRDLAVICYEDWIRAVMIDWNNFDQVQENQVKALYDDYLKKVGK